MPRREAAEPDDLDGRLLAALGQRRRPTTVEDLLRAARIERSARTAARERLAALEAAGRVVRTGRDRVVPAAALGLVAGVLHVHPDGFGFCRVDEAAADDVYVPRSGIRPAMHGDRVLVRLEGDRGARPAGRVVRVLARAVETLVGTYRRGARAAVVIPRDPRLALTLRVPRGAEGEAADGDLVVARLTRHPGPVSDAAVRIERVLGPATDPRVETAAVIAAFGLPEAFAPAVEATAAHVARAPGPAERAHRLDLRDLPLVTIDGETARDFDDAIHVTRTASGFRATIAIADVAHYVPADGPIDRAARARGTSVYFPDRALPMLPEPLSAGACSLAPGEERLVLSVRLDFDAEGTPTVAAFDEAVMRSRARLTYTEVRRALVDREAEARGALGPLLPDLESAEALARLRIARRHARGAIDFDLPEAEVVLDAEGRPTDVRRAERSIANRLIEELMLAANEAVARELARRDLPLLHRVHLPPGGDAVAELDRFLGGLGLHLALRDGELTPRAVQRILARAAGRPEARLVHLVLLRSMQQARYAAEPLGHFALATRWYCHFTSPIRRYPDLVVHRILKGTLHGAPAIPPDLAAIAAEASRRERIAMEAEREIVALKRVQLMQGQIGRSFTGHVSGVAAYGAFVELATPFVEGLVHVATLGDDFYEHDPARQCLRGRRTRRTIRLGDPVRVRCVGVSVDRREIDFVLEGPA